VDQIGTGNHTISHKIRIDGNALRLLSWLMSAVVACGSLRIADRLITRWSLVQVQLAPLFSHILLNGFLHITQMMQKPLFTQFLRNRPQTTSAIQSNTSFYRPIFLKSFPTSPFFRGNSGNSGNAIHLPLIFIDLQFI
jgi:hypothetical protein